MVNLLLKWLSPTCYPTSVEIILWHGKRLASDGLGMPDPGEDLKRLSTSLLSLMRVDKQSISIQSLSSEGKSQPSPTCLLCLYICVYICHCLCVCWHQKPYLRNHGIYRISSMQICNNGQTMGLVPITTQTYSLHLMLVSQSGTQFTEYECLLCEFISCETVIYDKLDFFFLMTINTILLSIKIWLKCWLLQNKI